jgi:hypothetical protein
MTSGVAIRMRDELAGLTKYHGMPTGQPHHEKDLPYCDPGKYLLRGYATVWRPDVERVMFARGSLKWGELPVLRYRHRDEIVGRVIELRDDAAGLFTEVETDDPIARCTAAFSIVATVQAYAIRDRFDRAAFRAEITKATLTEISLTPTPAHPQALVHQRMPVCASAEFNRVAMRFTAVARKLVLAMYPHIRSKPS